MGNNGDRVKQKEKRDKYNKFVLEREKKLRELQDKFEELLPGIIEETDREDDIPEITEGADGDISKETAVGKNHFKKSILIFAIVMGVCALLFAPLLFNVTGEGEALPAKRIVFKAPFDGILVNVQGDEGVRVKQGELVAEIHNRDIDFEMQKKAEQLNAVEKQLDMLVVTIARSENALERYRKLYRENASSWLEMERAQTNNEMLKIKNEELNQTRAQLEEQIHALQVTRQQSRFVAPFDGVVVTHNLVNQTNTFYKAGDKICELINDEKWIFETVVSEKNIGRIKVGQHATVHFKSSARRCPGVVYKIAEFSGRPVIRLNEIIANKTQSKKGIVVQILLEEKPAEIKYGIEGKVKINTIKRHKTAL